jgi:type I restriction enzyme, S subunit
VIPEGWKTVLLSDAVESLSSGVSVNGENVQAIDEEIGVLKISSVSSGVFLPEKNKRVIQKDVSRVKLNPKKATIIVSRANTPELVGASAFVNRDYPRLYLSDKLWQLETKSQMADVRWLAYVVGSEKYRIMISDLATGTSDGMKNVSKDAFLGLLVHLPPLEEQVKIAEVLTAWDDALETVGNLIAAKLEFRFGLMQQLLTGKSRLDGFESIWEWQKLGEVASIRRGASPRPISDPKWFSETGRGWLRISDVTASRMYVTKASQYLSDAGVSKSVPVEPGDFVMSICATIGVPRIIGFPACVHDGFVVIRDFESTLDKFFLYHYINLVTPELASGGQPGTQKNLNTTIVSEILIPKISLEEQIRIAEVLTTLDTELEGLRGQLERVKTQKKGLMQHLLTGKTRVKI